MTKAAVCDRMERPLKSGAFLHKDSQAKETDYEH